MEILLLIASVMASTTRSLLSKHLSSASGDLASFGRVNGLMSFCALIVISAYTAITDGWQCSLYTLGMSLLYALFTRCWNICWNDCNRKGSVKTCPIHFLD